MIYLNLLIVFLVLVAIHEYGHYIVARFFKAEVSDFSITLGNHYLNIPIRMERYEIGLNSTWWLCKN